MWHHHDGSRTSQEQAHNTGTVMAGLPKNKPTLPYGWIERISKTFPNRVYYFNTMTGASTWIVPFMLKQEIAKAKAKAKLKNRPRLSSQERDSGISCTSGGSVSPHSATKHQQPKPQKKDAPLDSLGSVGDNDLHDDEAGENVPMWSTFMDGYCKENQGNFEEDLTTLASGNDSLFEVWDNHGRVEASDPLRGEPVLYPNLGEVEDRLVTTARQMIEEEQPQYVNTKRGLHSEEAVGVHNQTLSRRKVEKVKPTPVRMHKTTEFHQSLLEMPSVASSASSSSSSSRDFHQGKTCVASSRTKRNGTEGGVSGPPRVSVKDRLGWHKYKQEKTNNRSTDKRQSPRGKRKAGKSNIHKQIKISPEKRKPSEVIENNNNNNKKSNKNVEGRRLLSSWDDVTVETDKPGGEGRSGIRKLMETKPEIKKSGKTKIPVKAPAPVAYKGPLTIFSSESFEDTAVDVTLSSPVQSHSKSMRLNIILDTNILLSYLTFVEELRDQYIPGFGRPILIIPWIVLHELDCLKDGKPSDLKDVRWSYKGSLSNKAKSAVTFINACLINKHPRVQGQSIQECSKKVGGVYTRSNDDKILQCLLQYKNRAKFTENVLVTEDMSLRNKAIVSSIHAYSKEALMDGLKDLSKNISKALLPRTPQRGATKRGMSNSPVLCSPKWAHVKSLTDTAVTELVDNIICNLRSILRQPLSVVLETEMKVAFDDLWLDVILHKPPWTFLDILDCFQKHWIAVFSHICDRSTRQRFEKLRDFYKINQGLGANLKTAEELVNDALQFLAHLKSHSSYNSALDAPMSSLNRYSEQLSLVNPSSSPHSASKTETARLPQRPRSSSSRNQNVKTLITAIQEVNSNRSPKAKKIREGKVEANTKITPKKIKLNRTCLKTKSALPSNTKNAPPPLSTKRASTSKTKSVAINVSEDVAMDTSSDTDLPSRKGTGHAETESKASGMGHSFTNRGKSPLNPEFIASGVDKLSEDQVHIVDFNKRVLPPDKCTMPSTPAAMWRQMTKAPPKSDVSPHPSPASSTTSMMSLTSQFSSPPANQEPADRNISVLSVLDTAYKEMYGMCTNIDRSVRQHQSSEYSEVQLNLKEAYTLVEYLLRYLEKQITAMNRVVTAAENNGLMASVIEQIFQELIDVIDGFFIGMEISSSGCGLTPERLKQFLKTDENRESLKRGIYQYQMALQGCQQCYQLISQVIQ